MSKAFDLTGQKFNKLTFIKRVENRGKQTYWLCQCDCGKQKEIQPNCIKNNKTKSCGCYNIQSFIDRQTKHGMAKTKIYKVWHDMKRRCCSPKDKDYSKYGGRGISVCDEWLLSFENFYKDMGKKYQEGLSLDRIDNDGNYEPSNCRWANKITQERNKSTNHILQTPFGEMCISELSEKTGFAYHLIKNRLKMGWDILKIINTPVRG